MIRDNAGNPISTYIGTIDPEEEQTCTIRVDCQENTNLTASGASAFVVEARHGAGAWIDIETTPIDLTPFAPATETFEIRITADAAIEGRNQFSVRVGP